MCVDVWFCACGAAFEATRFYNVSESSPLARELCDGPTCNEVESSTSQWMGEARSVSVTVQKCSFCSAHWLFCFSQASRRRTSATTCSAAWTKSSLSAAHATGTVVMMGSQSVGQTDKSTRTSVRWRCLLAVMAHASSRSLCPIVPTVRTWVITDKPASTHTGFKQHFSQLENLLTNHSPVARSYNPLSEYIHMEVWEQ